MQVQLHWLVFLQPIVPSSDLSSMRKKRTGQLSQNRMWIAFIVPVMVYLFLTQIYPLLRAVWMSFYATQAGKEVFVGLKNYLELARDSKFYIVLKNTLVFTVGSVSLHILFGLLIAIMIYNNQVFKSFLRSYQLIPWLFPPMVSCIFWLLMYQHPLGFINNVLALLGLTGWVRPWLGSPATAMISVIIVNLWVGYSFYALMMYTSLNAIPTSLFEAAQIDGANKWRIFYHITMPFLVPVILTLTILDLIWTVRVFDFVWILTKGGPVDSTEILATYTYKTAFHNFNFTKAASIGVYNLLIMIFFSSIYIRLYLGRRKEHGSL